MSQQPKNRDGKARELLRVSVQQDGDGSKSLVVKLPPDKPAASDEVDSMPLNPAWTYLSPMTVRVVRLLCAAGWLSREEIAQRLGEQPDGKLGPLLTDLAERCILESSPRKGYCLHLPDDVDPETYRKQLLAWLDRQHPGECDE